MEKYRSAERTIQSVKYLSTHADQDQCPTEEMLLELVTGIMEQQQSMVILDHCSICKNCAQRLRFAQEDLTEESIETPPLESAKPEWQHSLARQMASRISATRPQRKMRGLLIWAFAVPATAALVFATWLVFWPKTPDIGNMLANVYSQNRTLVLRFPGASYARLRQRRSGSQDSLFAGDPLIQQTREAIIGACKHRAASSQCLLFQAQLDLLDWRWQPALKALSQIEEQTQGADRSTEFLLARAIVLFEEAELSGSNENLYGQAVTDLTGILRSDPKNTVALFNRALIYEKLAWMQSASADWQALLAVEQDPGWRAEAKQHLDLIQQKKNSAL